MAISSEDFQGLSIEELLRSQAENRAWHKELRAKTAELIKTRLGKTISHLEYIELRNAAANETTECTRRATMLTSELSSRGHR